MKKITLKPISGYFGEFGGSFTSELLYPALFELRQVFNKLKSDKQFLEKYRHYLLTYAGRPTPLYYASNRKKRNYHRNRSRDERSSCCHDRLCIGIKV